MPRGGRTLGVRHCRRGGQFPPVPARALEEWTSRERSGLSLALFWGRRRFGRRRGRGRPRAHEEGDRNTWELFFAAAERQQKRLQEAASVGQAFSEEPWALMVVTARGLELGADQARRFDQAHERQPFHRRMWADARRTCSKWGGREGDVRLRTVDQRQHAGEVAPRGTAFRSPTSRRSSAAIVTRPSMRGTTSGVGKWRANFRMAWSDSVPRPRRRFRAPPGTQQLRVHRRPGRPPFGEDGGQSV